MADNVKVSKFGNLQKSFVRFFKEIRNELKKVIWLNREQLTNNTATVLLSSLIVGVIIWAADAVFTQAVLLLIK
jgi:preprotein translocase subunit SecE